MNKGGDYIIIIARAFGRAQFCIRAITRARKLLVLVGDDVTPVKMAANDRQQRRYSGLRRRLKEGMA